MGLDKVDTRRGEQAAMSLATVVVAFLVAVLLEAIWDASWRIAATTFVVAIAAAAGVTLWMLWPRAPRPSVAGLFNWVPEPGAAKDTAGRWQPGDSGTTVVLENEK